MGGDSGFRYGQGVFPPGVEEIGDRTRLTDRPSPPLPASEESSNVLETALRPDQTAYQGGRELGQDPAGHGRVVTPPWLLPGAVQQIRIERHIGQLQQREFSRAAPVALTVVLVRSGDRGR